MKLTKREKKILAKASKEYWRSGNKKLAVSCIFAAIDELNISLSMMQLIHFERLVMHGEDSTGDK